MVTIEELKAKIDNRYDGLNNVLAYGEQSYFYNPDNSLPRGVYFVTIKEQDGINDKSSHLDREGIFRLSFGLTPKSYKILFGNKPKRPTKGCIVEVNHSFTELNKLMPHPVYAWIGWVQILNPDKDALSTIFELLDEKFDVIKKEYRKKISKKHN